VGQENSEEFMTEAGSYTSVVRLLESTLFNGALLASEPVQPE
jgi:hypothetical protein